METITVNKSIEKVILEQCNNHGDFKLVHFRDVYHAKKTKGHYWVLIPSMDGQGGLLSMITSQSMEFNKKYDGDETALNSLIFVSGSHLYVLSKDSVIDCNKTVFLFKQQLVDYVDATFVSPKTHNCFDIAYQRKGKPWFDSELKNGILEAIINSLSTSQRAKDIAVEIRKTLPTMYQHNKVNIKPQSTPTDARPPHPQE